MDDKARDHEWMTKAAAGDQLAFDRIVQAHQATLQRFATRMLGGDATTGADVTVAAFLRLWQGRHNYKPTGSVLGWLLKTAYRLCLDELRSSTEAEPLADEPSITADHEQRSMAEAVKLAVLDLPEIQRAVIVLSTYEGLTYSQIAETLDIPEGTVASRRNAAITTLRQKLANWTE